MNLAGFERTVISLAGSAPDAPHVALRDIDDAHVGVASKKRGPEFTASSVLPHDVALSKGEADLVADPTYASVQVLGLSSLILGASLLPSTTVRAEELSFSPASRKARVRAPSLPVSRLTCQLSVYEPAVETPALRPSLSPLQVEVAAARGHLGVFAGDVQAKAAAELEAWIQLEGAWIAKMGEACSADESMNPGLL